MIAAALRTAVRFRGVIGAAVWIFVTLVVAWAQRGEGSDEAVIGSLGGLTLPLMSFTFVSASLFGGSLRSAVAPLVRLGASPLRALLTMFSVPVGASALAGAVVGAIVVAITRTPSSPIVDLFMTTWIAALGGAAYAALFVAGSSLGKRGGGRSVVLALDFVLGASSGLFGAVSVRGHVRNLLGGVAPLEMSQRTSCVVLMLVVAAAFGLAHFRLRPTQARLRTTARSNA